MEKHYQRALILYGAAFYIGNGIFRLINGSWLKAHGWVWAPAMNLTRN